jgi:hypothetical protein
VHAIFQIALLLLQIQKQSRVTNKAII